MSLLEIHRLKILRTEITFEQLMKKHNRFKKKFEDHQKDFERVNDQLRLTLSETMKKSIEQDLINQIVYLAKKKRVSLWTELVVVQIYVKD